MAEIVAQPSLQQSHKLINLRFVWRLLFVTLIVRLFYAWTMQLVPDEAFYWVWTRHLSTGYLDHPPMIAYLLWLGTHLLGSTELGVRFVGVLLSIGTTMVIVLLARRILRDERAAAWVATIWLVSPLIALTGLIATPDMPATFFSVCGLACAAVIADCDDRDEERSSAAPWLLFGLFTGLALLSKYPAVLLPAGAGLAMLLSRKGLAHFRRPWIYLAGLIALLVFSPVIWWNWHHQWASFLFQLRHGSMADEQMPRGVSSPGVVPKAFADLFQYIGGQAILWTPVLFGIAILVLAEFWRRYRRIGQVDRVLLWTGTLPLLFFAAMYVKSHKGEINWPGFAYFPISILIGRWLSENWSKLREGWVRGGCQVALGFTVTLYLTGLPPVTRAILRLPLRMPHTLKDLVDHDKEGRELFRQSTQADAPVICNHYQDAGEAALYMPGQPDVWCIGIGARPTAFDYFDHPPDFARTPRVLWDGGHWDLFCAKYGYHRERINDWVEVFGPKTTRTLTTDLLVRDRR